jgi:hypothetical protein
VHLYSWCAISMTPTKTREWDPGNYLEKRQAEEGFIFPE